MIEICFVLKIFGLVLSSAEVKMSAAVQTQQQQPREETPADEVRVMHNGHIAMYVKYAARLFTEQNKDKITVRASGSAIPLAISTIEILRRRIVGLHQEVNIGRSQLVHEVEVPPQENNAEAGNGGAVPQEGEKQTRTRSVPFLHVVLSKTVEHVNTNSPGYEKPLDPSLVEKFKDLREPTAATGADGTAAPSPPRTGGGVPFGRGNGRRTRGRGGRFAGTAPGGLNHGGPRNGPRGSNAMNPRNSTQGAAAAQGTASPPTVNTTVPATAV